MSGLHAFGFLENLKNKNQVVLKCYFPPLICAENKFKKIYIFCAIKPQSLIFINFFDDFSESIIFFYDFEKISNFKKNDARLRISNTILQQDSISHSRSFRVIELELSRLKLEYFLKCYFQNRKKVRKKFRR